ncbi:AfsR/SARP family transcriptional regulator [Lentzea flaviverrucosa]|uniref:DNA-binding transcriptional activator of the SARP family n=1 Tax=Lentzea flaviverrucosa TaxID=200379 RepID=A0A1H9XSM0_9PSEU|nr:BTAD domain-containing putative transcriptional regulator [Lentzea flaviverrucosa]RDI19289.1 DNA-binding SARP family transcriptional activator [Lentzea flaviverrucosa]SES49141.1 DNA-binding transcriptional activator of the SARP family [Lentzea flaviverrucosa]
MRFQVLGPVEVRVGAQRVELGGARPATLLAVLATAVGEVVGMDEIVEAVWGSRSPRNSRAAVHTNVCALRRALTADVIVRRGGGYLLDVPPEQVDAWEFGSRAARGRKALGEHRHAEAAAEFQAALALWRGGALGGATGAWADGERARLADLRLAVVEDQLDVAATTGLAVAPVAELVALVAANPLRERLRAQVVLALSGLGRQAEALACYEAGRRILADELGVDPGRELRDAHRRVLAGQPAVTSPAQLPPDIADFAGRDDELARLCRRLTGTSDVMPVVAISGQAGTGKSTLAVRAAHQVRERYPDGQLYASLRGVREPGEVIVRFLHALGVSDAAMPRCADERILLYRSLVAGRRVLVVLDDAADERQVRPLLPGSPTCACVLTSRSRPSALEGAAHVELGTLGEGESLVLLDRIVGAGRVAAEPGFAREVVRLCGRLPLALRIAGARLVSRTDWSPGRLASRLREQHRLLDELAIGDLEVRGSLALSYTGLSASARAGLRGLGWFGVPHFEPWLAAALLGVAAQNAEDVVDELVRARLLDVVGAGRYRLHDLTRTFGWELAEAEDVRQDLLDAVERVARGWSRLLALPATQEWFDAGQAAVVHTVERACELGLADVAVRLTVDVCTSKLAADNKFSLRWQTHSVALDAAVRAGDVAGQAELLAGLGWLRREQDRLDEATAYYERSKEKYGEIGDSGAITAIKVMLSEVLRERGDLAGALDLVTAVMPDLADAALTARAWHGRGKAFTELGRLPEAVGALERAREAYLRLVEPREVALVERSLAIAHRAAGAFGTAERLSARALRTLRDLGDRHMTAYAVQAWAKARIRQGGPDEVHDALQEALVTCRGLQDGFGQALVLRTLGELELARGRPEEACRQLGLSLQWWDALSLPLWRARSLRDMAVAHRVLGRPAEAGRAWDEARALFVRHGSREATELSPPLPGSQDLHRIL